MRKIPLTQGKFALVDDEDYERLSKFKWCVLSRGYAVRSDGGRCCYMHREIAGTPKGMDTDHINGDKLDNRRRNLRICSHQENMRAYCKPARGGSSRFRGVSRCVPRDKWVAQIYHNGRNLYLGLFPTEVEAARERDRRAREFYGGHAQLNFK